MYFVVVVVIVVLVGVLIVVGAFHLEHGFESQLGLVKAKLFGCRNLELVQGGSNLLDEPRVDHFGIRAGLPLIKISIVFRIKLRVTLKYTQTKNDI